MDYDWRIQGAVAGDYFGQQFPSMVLVILLLSVLYSEIGGGSNKGSVYIYQFNQSSSQWALLGGGPISGSNNDDYFGNSISLNHQEIESLLVFLEMMTGGQIGICHCLSVQCYY